MVLELIPPPPRSDGTVLDWGIVSSVDPLTFTINGEQPAVPVARQAAEASFLVTGDKILALRNGYGGYVYLDLIDDVVTPAAPGVPITSLQPDAVDPATGLPTTPEEPPIDPATGMLPRFARLNTPTDVRITNIQWNRVTVTWAYAPSTDPLVPMTTGFEVRIREVHAGRPETVRTSETVAGAATRGRTLGSLEPTTWYVADVRAVTEASSAYAAYTANQVTFALSSEGEVISNLFSGWGTSPRARTMPPPLSPVIPPTNVRWVPPLKSDRLGVAWDYRQLAGSPIADGFEVKVCTNSQGNQGCVSNDVSDPAARERTMRPLDDNVSYFGFVRTKSGRRNSRWESIGPPRRTAEDNAPGIRNLRLARSTDNPDDVTWTAEVRHATRLTTKVVWQQQAIVAQTRQNVGPPWVQDFHAPLSRSGLSDRDVWTTVTGTLTGDYAGVGVLTFTLRALNNYSRTDASASLATRAIPAFLALTLTQVGNRVHHLMFTGATFSGAGLAARWFAQTVRSIWRISAFARRVLAGRVIIVGGGGPGGRATIGDILRTAARHRSLARSAAYKATTAAGAGGVSETLRRTLIGVRMEVGVGALGWETGEVELGVRLPGADTFTTDYTWNFRNDYSLPPGEPVYTSQTLTAADILNPLDTRYYVPGAEIRVRVRVTNSVGTTDWMEAKYRGTDFINPLATRTGPGDSP